MAINGRVMGLELFEAPDSLGKYFHKILTSYALDALDLKPAAGSGNGVEDRARAWLGEFLELGVHSRPSLSLGFDLRFEGERINGSALLYENSVLYLSAFPLPEQEEGSNRARLARAGVRRRL